MSEEDLTHPDPEAHLAEKLNTLVALVDEGYGKALLDQLIQRLEITVKEFTDEISALVDHLRQNASTQEELLEMIRKQDLTKAAPGAAAMGGRGEGLTEWERRLAESESAE